MITKRGALGYFSRATPAPHLRRLATIGVSVWFVTCTVHTKGLYTVHAQCCSFVFGNYHVSPRLPTLQNPNCSETWLATPQSYPCILVETAWHSASRESWSSLCIFACELFDIVRCTSSCSLDSKDWVHSKLEETEQTGNAWKQPRSRATFGEGSQPSEPEVLPKLTDPVEIGQRWEELMSADPEHLGRDNANALQNCQQQKNFTIWCKRSGQVDTCICLFTHCNYTVLYASYVYMPCFLHTTNRYS